MKHVFVIDGPNKTITLQPPIDNSTKNKRLALTSASMHTRMTSGFLNVPVETQIVFAERIEEKREEVTESILPEETRIVAPYAGADGHLFGPGTLIDDARTLFPLDIVSWFYEPTSPFYGQQVVTFIKDGWTINFGGFAIHLGLPSNVWLTDIFINTLP